MSDTSQGSGWWMASDAKWYPPESHPSNLGKSLPPPPDPPIGPAPAFAAPPLAQPGLVDPKGRPLATFWTRVGATLLDGAVASAINYCTATLALGLTATSFHFDPNRQVTLGSILAAVGVFLVAYVLIATTIQVTYLVIQLGIWGKTLGNRAVSTVVVNADNGAAIGWGKAFGRTGAAVALNLTLIGGLLDVLWPLWDERMQTLHDKMAGTLVVHE